MVCRTQPAPDYAPLPSWSWKRAYWTAIADATSSIIDPWPAVRESRWYTWPIRDRLMIGQDFWRAARQLSDEYQLPLDVHPEQGKLFDLDVR